MKINLYLSTVCPSGGTYILLDYATRLLKRGYDVRCYYNVNPLFFSETYGVMDAIANSWVVRLLRRQKRITLGRQEITELIKRYPLIDIEIVKGMTDSKIECADVGIAGSWASAYMLNEDKNTQKKCYLIQDYEDWDKFGRGRKSYFLPLERIVISEALNDMLKEKLNIGPFPIIHNGIDLDIYRPYVQKNTVKENIICAMLYSKGKSKGCEVGIEAFLLLKKDMPNIRLIMFGVPQKPDFNFEFEYFENATAKELVDIYQRADIFIWPSIFEGWGLTPCEAMACKCTVVGSDTASMKEIGVDGFNCLLSEPGDVHGLYKNLKAAASNSELREKLSCNALETVKQLSWDKSISDLEKHF